MSDAVKVGFVPFSAASRGILVVFCDDSLKFGAASLPAPYFLTTIPLIRQQNGRAVAPLGYG